MFRTDPKQFKVLYDAATENGKKEQEVEESKQKEHDEQTSNK